MSTSQNPGGGLLSQVRQQDRHTTALLSNVLEHRLDSFNNRPVKQKDFLVRGGLKGLAAIPKTHECSKINTALKKRCFAGEQRAGGTNQEDDIEAAGGGLAATGVAI